MRQFVGRRRGASAGQSTNVVALDNSVIRDRINRSMRRRMSDDLVSLIRRACMCGHAEAAKGLWVVLRDLTDRETRQKFPHGRIPDESLIQALAMEIATAARSNRSGS